MTFGCTGGRSTRLVWGLFLLGATSAIITSIGLGLTGKAYSGLDLPTTPMEQITQGLLLVALWVILGSPFLTAHELRAEEVILRQGLHFQATVPFDDIEEVNEGSRRPIGIGVRWYPGVLFVITWPTILVEIKLRRRRVFRLFRLIPLPSVSTIAVNVDDPTRFVNALQAGLNRRSD